MSLTLKTDRMLEADIKALTLNYLRDKKIIDNESIIMNELTIGNFVRRVDLAIYTKGKLIAFEIKSEADSLTRLDGQIEKYLEYFDKVVIVADTKFIPKINKNLLTNVGLWEVNSLNIKIHNKGRYIYNTEKSKLINLMDVVDLAKLSSKLKIQSEKHRGELEKSLLNAASKDLRLGVQASISRKFKDVNMDFIKKTEGKTISNEDLKALSRFRKKREKTKKNAKLKKEFWDNIDQHIETLTKFSKAAIKAA